MLLGLGLEEGEKMAPSDYFSLPQTKKVRFPYTDQTEQADSGKAHVKIRLDMVIYWTQCAYWLE